MKKNVGAVDRALRIIFGLVLISLVYIGPQTAWGWLGILPILTGIFSFCPAYLPFKLSTAKSSK